MIRWIKSDVGKHSFHISARIRSRGKWQHRQISPNLAGASARCVRIAVIVPQACEHNRAIGREETERGDRCLDIVREVRYLQFGAKISRVWYVRGNKDASLRPLQFGRVPRRRRVPIAISISRFPSFSRPLCT